MLSPTTSFADVECDTMVEDSRKNEFLNEKIEELGTLVSETNNRLSDFEAENVLLKTQLDESQKLNVINAEKISAMAEMNDEAKAKATNLKDQFDDAKKMHETEREELHEKLEDVEARTVVLKSQLDESKQLNGTKSQEISEMAKMNDEAKAKAKSLRDQFDDAKKSHKVEKRDLDKKLKDFKTQMEEMKKTNKIEQQKLTDKFDEEKAKVNRTHNTTIKALQNSNTEVKAVTNKKLGGLLSLFK